MEQFLAAEPGIALEYFTLADGRTLQPITGQWSSGSLVALCLAAHVGGVRLIDNVLVTLP
ncbi:pantoate--beta-alanine ligase [Hymenobacter cellulosivorans]|uniref:pantoate--beta-alanine ligase n=1 Tax=Hymenobacter cellulosivorans TaxID=2932249 RepID=UPI0021D43C58|nr:pantoate--beta-alanine ligase [Hymenobacter cellulosivorans]